MVYIRDLQQPSRLALAAAAPGGSSAAFRDLVATLLEEEASPCILRTPPIGGLAAVDEVAAVAPWDAWLPAALTPAIVELLPILCSAAKDVPLPDFAMITAAGPVQATSGGAIPVANTAADAGR